MCYLVEKLKIKNVIFIYLIKGSSWLGFNISVDLFTYNSYRNWFQFIAPYRDIAPRRVSKNLRKGAGLPTWLQRYWEEPWKWLVWNPTQCVHFTHSQVGVWNVVRRNDWLVEGLRDCISWFNYKYKMRTQKYNLSTKVVRFCFHFTNNQVGVWSAVCRNDWLVEGA